MCLFAACEPGCSTCNHEITSAASYTSCTVQGISAYHLLSLCVAIDLGSYSAQKLQYSTRIRNAYSVCLLAELETLVKLLDVSAFLFLVRCVQCS